MLSKIKEILFIAAAAVAAAVVELAIFITQMWQPDNNCSTKVYLFKLVHNDFSFFVGSKCSGWPGAMASMWRNQNLHIIFSLLPRCNKNYNQLLLWVITSRWLSRPDFDHSFQLRAFIAALKCSSKFFSYFYIIVI